MHLGYVHHAFLDQELLEHLGQILHLLLGDLQEDAWVQHSAGRDRPVAERELDANPDDVVAPAALLPLEVEPKQRPEKEQ